MNMPAAVCEHLPDGILVLQGTQITYGNPQAATLLGCASPAELAGQPAGAFLTEDSGQYRVPGAEFVEVVATVPLSGSPQEGVMLVLRDVSDLRALERELLHLADTAGQRIARDLHDGLGQEIAAIRFQAAALQVTFAGVSPEATAATAELMQHLEEAGEHIRQLAHGLDVSSYKHSLETALRKLAANTSARYPAACRCHLPAEPSRLAPATVMHLQQIAREAVTNALRHGRAREVNITLEVSDGTALLTVEDDGTGFAFDGKGSGIGLRIMHYRARELGGAFEIHANPGGGSTVICRVPRTHAAHG